MFTWVGVWAPAGTPDAIVLRLQTAFAAIEHKTQAMIRLIKAKHITVN